MISKTAVESFHVTSRICKQPCWRTSPLDTAWDRHAIDLILSLYYTHPRTRTDSVHSRHSAPFHNKFTIIMANFRAVFTCGNRAGRDKKSFHRLPAEITREGDRTQELSRERRMKWLAVISRNIPPKNPKQKQKQTPSLPYTRVLRSLHHR